MPSVQSTLRKQEVSPHQAPFLRLAAALHGLVQDTKANAEITMRLARATRQLSTRGQQAARHIDAICPGLRTQLPRKLAK